MAFIVIYDKFEVNITRDKADKPLIFFFCFFFFLIFRWPFYTEQNLECCIYKNLVTLTYFFFFGTLYILKSLFSFNCILQPQSNITLNPKVCKINKKNKDNI